MVVASRMLDGQLEPSVECAWPATPAGPLLEERSISAPYIGDGRAPMKARAPQACSTHEFVHPGGKWCHRLSGRGSTRMTPMGEARSGSDRSPNPVVCLWPGTAPDTPGRPRAALTFTAQGSAQSTLRARMRQPRTSHWIELLR